MRHKVGDCSRKHGSTAASHGCNGMRIIVRDGLPEGYCSMRPCRRSRDRRDAMTQPLQLPEEWSEGIAKTWAFLDSNGATNKADVPRRSWTSGDGRLQGETTAGLFFSEL